MIPTGIDSVRGKDKDVYRTHFIATKAATLANFLQNLDLRH
jgi:hypothetical protein